MNCSVNTWPTKIFLAFRGCNLAVTELDNRIFSLGARQGFEFLPLLNHQLNKMKEGGLVNWLRKKYLEPIASTKEYICSSQEVVYLNNLPCKKKIANVKSSIFQRNEPESVAMSQIYVFFLLVLIGAVVAILLFLVERVTKKREYM